jgi:hypothetical protein
MEKRASILKCHEIDTASLEPLSGFGTDKVFRVIVPGSRGIELWRRLRSIVKETGHWPVILGDDRNVESLRENASFIRPTESADIIAAGEAMNAATWLEGARNGSNLAPILANPKIPETLKKVYRNFIEERRQANTAEIQKSPPESWPEDISPNDGIRTTSNVDGLIEQLSVGLVPVSEMWHVPAVLRFGNFNGCPHPKVHLCMIKHWNQTHEAEIFAMTSDSVELVVLRPPTTREGAILLERDQATYCCDADEQIGCKPGDMRAMLLNRHVWYFWWD